MSPSSTTYEEVNLPSCVLIIHHLLCTYILFNEIKQLKNFTFSSLGWCGVAEGWPAQGAPSPVPPERPGSIPHLEVFLTWKYSSPGSIPHLEVFLTWKYSSSGSIPHLEVFLTWKYSSPGSIPHLEVFLTWKYSSPGSIPHLEVFLTFFFLGWCGGAEGWRAPGAPSPDPPGRRPPSRCRPPSPRMPPTAHECPPENK